MKTCTCCKVEKDESEFGSHTESRPTKLNGRNPYAYTNSQCKKCVTEKARLRRIKLKDDPEFIKKHAQYAKMAYWRNREMMLRIGKKSRDKPENKERRKRYDAEHRDKIRQQSLLVNKKYCQRHIDQITERYALIQLAHPRNGVTREEITPQLIQIKQKQIKSWRTLKELRNSSRNQ